MTFFDSEKNLKIKKYKKVMEKVFERIKGFDDYKRQILRKSASIALISDQSKTQVKSLDKAKASITE